MESKYLEYPYLFLVFIVVILVILVVAAVFYLVVGALLIYALTLMGVTEFSWTVAAGAGLFIAVLTVIANSLKR